MIQKVKDWLFGKVILSKVAGKFAKHATGALIGLLSSPAVAKYLETLGISIDPAQLQAGMLIVVTGAFGALWNFIEHRFLKK